MEISEKDFKSYISLETQYNQLMALILREMDDEARTIAKYGRSSNAVTLSLRDLDIILGTSLEVVLEQRIEECKCKNTTTD